MASVITRDQLQFKDYNWGTYGDDDARVSGSLNESVLSRSEGYEILYFINKFCEVHQLNALSSAEKIERMLRDSIPRSRKSQKTIQKWIVNNWRDH
jgi:hypothetical protein